MILERRIKKRNLNRLDILINDTSNEFLQVFEVPDSLPQGRSSFTINGSEFLKTNTEVLVEILDNNNNPIFVNAIFDPEYVTMQGTSRSMSVEVYPTTPAGRAVLTIVGELDHKKFIGSQPLTPELLTQLNIETDPIFTGDVSIAKAVADNFFIPKEFQGVYNVKFNKVILINPKARNTQPIKFYRKPQIQVRELIRTEIKPSASIFIDTVNVSTGSISGKRINPEKTLRLVNPAEITPVRSMISCDAKPAPQGGYTDLVGPNTLQGTIYNRAYPLELTSEDSYGSIIRRSWEFGDTHVTESFSIPDATNPKGVERQIHTYTKSGTYTAKLTVASPTGQYDIDTETITLSAPSAPVAGFTVTHPTASADGSTKQTGSMEDPNGRTFKFKDTSTGVDNISDPLVFGSKFTNINDTEYSWSFGDGNYAKSLGSVLRNPIHTYTQAGTYNVALTVKNNYGTQTDTETKTNHILIKPSLPIVDFSVNSGSITEVQAVGATAAAILGATATFTNTTVYNGSSITYAWAFNTSGSTSTATSPTCIYTGSTYVADTTFDVTLVATDDWGRSVTKTKKNLISIAPSIPAPNFTSNIQEFTFTGSFEAKRVEYTDTSTSDSALTYKYDFNGGTTGSNLNTHAGSTTFEAADLSGGIFEAGVSSPLTLGITFENPRAGTRCLKLYNGGSSLLSNPYTFGYDYGNSGEATLSAWVSQYSLATITRNHMYTMEFWARADEPTTLMTGMFGANSNGYIFGSGASQGTFAIKGQKVGTSWQKFNWTFSFTDVGCQYLTIRLGTTTLNAGKAVYFDNIEVYKSTSTVKDPRIDYRTKTDGARGLVKQSVTNTLGTERSIQIPNFINAQFGAPSASFVIDDSSILTEVPVTFNASGSNGFTDISEYRWDWADGDFDVTTNPVITHKYSSAATYVPKLTVVTSEGQSTQVNRGNVVVSAPAAPTVSLSYIEGFDQSTGEAPHEVLLKMVTANQVTASNITFGNGDTANSTRGFTVYNVPGVYTITGTVAGPGGSASATKTITVSSPPEAATEELVEDPEPAITADLVRQAETGTQLGSGGGIDPAPPAPYTGGGGGGDPYTGCVLAGTIIKTARGDVPVEQVTTDDLVYSYNFESGEFAYYKIEKAWSKKQPTRVFVETESGKSVECSDTHLFYHPDYKNQEICVKNLTVGDIIYTIDDDENVIEDPIRNIVTYDEEVEVYNFNVPDIYSYITNDIVSHNREKYESGAPNPFNTPYQMNLASPETEVFEIETNQTGTFFKKEMLGADLTIFPSLAGTDMETLNSTVPTDRQFVIKQQPLTTKIRKIGARGRVIVPDIKGLMVTNRLNSHKGVVFSEYQDFGPSDYSMSYQKPVTASFRVINKQSYSKINLTQLRPYSGDVSKVKVYYKTPGDVGGYKLLTDSTLEAPEQLADPTIQFGRLKIGYIPIQQHIDYYWFSRQGIKAGFYEGIDSSTPTAGLTYVNDPYIDSMRISGSNYPHNSVVTAFHKYPMRLVAGTEYAVRFELAGIKKNKQHTPENAAATGDTSEQAAKIRFYISGSSLKGDDGWGNLLGIMELDIATAVSESFDTVEHNFIAENNGDGRLQLVAESGEWYMGDLSVKPMRESGFSPDFSSLVVPTPKLNQRPTNVEYYAEFYDLNGNASDLMAIGQSVKTFQGSSLIVEGVDNTISGSLFLGGETEGSGIEIHGGSSYVRNVGYVGYYSASQQQSVDDPTVGKAGFMFWSGSVLTDRTDEYSVGDVGFEIHGGPGVKDGSAGAMRFRSSTGKLEVTGSIVATEGHFAKNFSVGTGSAAIEISSSRYIMKTKNWNHPTSSKGWAISGSGQAFFQEGYIGGWQIRAIDEGTATERSIISGSNITLDAGGAALYMSNKGPGSDSGATFPVLADEYYLDFTPDSSEAVTSADYYVSFGPKFKIDKEGTMFASGAKFVGTITASAGLIGGFNIGSASIYGGNNEGVPDFFLSGSQGHGSTGYNKSNLFISSSGFQVTHDGAIKGTSGSIGGWTIENGKISSANLNIDSSGLLETADYASGFKGWRISSANNGSAEFEQVTIRGTLKTAVFEKESVNAVGGQLYIANSTTITGSNDVGVDDTTIQVANASGFAAGEIITAKKVTSTGFGTEYMLVQSAAREDSSSDSNFSGSVVVVRQYGVVSASGSGASGSLGGTPGAKQTYGPGQVIVSTGKLNTGYIRLNANPNDISTPYMDIVERTGSGVYDVSLKARLGDLSGLSAARLQAVSAPASPGFGLYTDNVYLKGAITATTGSIGGINMQSGKLYNGTGTHGNSNTGFYVDSASKFSLGDKLVWDGSSLTIEGSITLTGGAGVATPASVSGSMAEASSSAITTAGVSASAALSSVSGSFSTSGTTTSASSAAAQLAIDTMETQVVLDSTGMGLWNEAGSVQIAEYGTTSTYWDGVGHADTNRKLELNASGITLWGGPAAGNDYVNLAVGSLSMYSNAVRTLHITDHGINIGKSATGPSSDGATSAVIGNISLHSAGAHIYGAATDDYVNIKSDGVDVVAAGVTQAAFGATTTIGHTSNEHISLSTSGLDVKDGATSLASFGAAVRVGIDHASKSALRVDASGNLTIGTSGTSNVIMTNTGALTLAAGLNAVHVKATSGSIGGWQLDTGLLKSSDGNIRLNASSKKITINSHTFGNSGIQLDYNAGTPRFYVGDGANDYITYTHGVGVDIKTAKFVLDTTYFDVSATGQVTASSLLLTGGKAGGQTITTDGMSGGTGGRFQVTGSTGQMTASLALIGNSTGSRFQVAAGGITLKTENFSLATSTVTMSSAGAGSITMGSTPPTASGGSGILLSGSGHFSFQTGSSYIRNDASGFAMNFPSFSISPAGYMTTTDANFKGHIEASTGFIGTTTSSGWNIDGSTIGDVNGKIILDASQNSPNITITTGSYFAEMVPGFTPAAQILSAGGNAYSGSTSLGNITKASMHTTTGVFTITDNNGARAPGDGSLSAGQTSTALYAFGGYSNTGSSTGGGGKTSFETTLTELTDATLSGGGKVYKSVIGMEVAVAVDVPHSGQNPNLSGFCTISGSLLLRKSSDNSIVSITSIGGGMLIDVWGTSNPAYKEAQTRTVTISHTVGVAGGSAIDYYAEIGGVTVAHGGITETYYVGEKSFTTACDIKEVAVSFITMNHSPSNKKVEIAPKGIQAVFLEESELENASNKYFRVTPDESKTVDIMGGAYITGSLNIKGLGAATQTVIGGGYVRGADGSSGTPSIQVGSDSDGFYHSGGIKMVVGNVAEEFFFADGGHFHADNNITAYSSTISSDIRLKENIKPLENNLDKILELKPSSFRWKVRDKRDDVGLIAQEVESVLPMIVEDSISIGTTKEFLDGDTHKVIDYAKLTTYLIGAIQEQQTQIENLDKFAHEPQNYKEKCDDMEKRIIELEKKLEVT